MSQKQKVLKHLRKYGSITSWTAIQRYRITRLSAVIKQLRDDGYDIETEMVEKKTDDEIIRYGKYTLNERS